MIHSIVLLLLLLWPTASAVAANLETTEKMQKQVGKLATDSLFGHDAAKALCACRFAGGVHAGFVFHFTSTAGAGQHRVSLDCGVPIYSNTTGDLLSSTSCNSAGGTWEFATK